MANGGLTRMQQMWEDLGDVFKAADNALGGVLTTMRTFIATPIGAAIGAVTAVIALLNKNLEVSNTLAEKWTESSKEMEIQAEATTKAFKTLNAAVVAGDEATLRVGKLTNEMNKLREATNELQDSQTNAWSRLLVWMTKANASIQRFFGANEAALKNESRAYNQALKNAIKSSEEYSDTRVRLEKEAQEAYIGSTRQVNVLRRRYVESGMVEYTKERIIELRNLNKQLEWYITRAGTADIEWRKAGKTRSDELKSQAEDQKAIAENEQEDIDAKYVAAQRSYDLQVEANNLDIKNAKRQELLAKAAFDTAKQMGADTAALNILEQEYLDKKEQTLEYSNKENILKKELADMNITIQGHEQERFTQQKEYTLMLRTMNLEMMEAAANKDGVMTLTEELAILKEQKLIRDEELEIQLEGLRAKKLAGNLTADEAVQLARHKELQAANTAAYLQQVAEIKDAHLKDFKEIQRGYEAVGRDIKQEAAEVIASLDPDADSDMNALTREFANRRAEMQRNHKLELEKAGLTADRRLDIEEQYNKNVMALYGLEMAAKAKLETDKLAVMKTNAEQSDIESARGFEKVRLMMLDEMRASTEAREQGLIDQATHEQNILKIKEDAFLASVQLVAAYADVSIQTGQMISDAMAAFADNEVDDKQRAFDKTLEARDEAAAAGNRAEQARLDARLEQEAKALEQAQEERKKFEIAGVIMSTAAGIVGTWATSLAQLGPIAGPIVAGIQSAALVATAAAQIQAIKSADTSVDIPSASGSGSADVPDIINAPPEVNTQLDQSIKAYIVEDDLVTATESMSARNDAGTV